MTASVKYDYAAAAEELGVSPRWLVAHIQELPHVRFGGGRNARVWFMQEHIDAIRAMFTRWPSQPTPAPAAPVPLAAVSGDLRPVPSRGRRQPVAFPTK